MADAGGQARKIVHRTNQHDADCDPQQTRQPAEGQTGGDRTCNRSGRCDGREVLAKKIKPLGGNEVFPVVYGMSGSRFLVIN